MAIATAYWAATVAVFVVSQVAGFDMTGNGAIPVATLTFPLSAVMIAVGSSTPSAELQPLISPLGTFIVFPVICGGANALAIVGLLTAIAKRGQKSRRTALDTMSRDAFQAGLYENAPMPEGDSHE